MKTLPPLPLLIVLILGCQSREREPGISEFLPSDYVLDGSVSHLEMMDTIQMTTYYEDENLVIREAKDRYYIGVRSNRKTILSAYYLAPDQLKVMHASGALGETNFLRTDEYWVKDRPKWDWRYRDTVIWGRYHKEDYLHKDPIQDFETYYQTFGWVANTISFGSNREMELVISKDLVEDVTNFCVSYEFDTPAGVRTIIAPGRPGGITQNDSLNALIHEGAIPLLPDTLLHDFFKLE